ncbi:MAG TPA: hypothetical protein VMG10_33745 [Gemmataceae bacterium]|nr:hypothetical protein [Gemmataceae bacterium]
MRLFLLVTFVLVLAAGVPGCASKSPADSNPPPGVIQNPNPPNPDAIKRRKPMLIDPRRSGSLSRFNRQH